MSTALTISDVGLRLIKAYEGFRPVDVELVSGQRVAGYGHRVMTGESLHLSEKKAEKLLRRDLAPYEAMINDSIFAPLTQSQFDALCSLAFNIGPKKFLESDVVRALNNGRVLDAANGFDVWRKGEINGESYVVDALVRRRTAEKVLFLRPSLRSVRAPRVDLDTVADDSLAGATTAAAPRVFEESGFVPTVNFDVAEQESDSDVSQAAQTPLKEATTAETEPDIDVIDDLFVERRNPDSNIPTQATPMRRRDDRPGGVLTLSEVFDEEKQVETSYDDNEDLPWDSDDARDPLIKDLEGFTLDIETEGEAGLITGEQAEEAPLELTDLVGSDVDTAEDDTAFSDIEEQTNDTQELDPSDYIIGQTGEVIARDTDDNALVELDTGPSPIATAAAEVSDRLDALMAKRDENAVVKDNKVLPFRAKASAGDATKLRQDNPLYGSLIPSGSDESDIELSQKSGLGTDKLLEEARANADKRLSEQKDSASRYIANTIAPRKSKKSNLGLNLLVILGMILLAVSVATMMSGFDQRFGVGGEFLSTVGALFGLMITLGSIYYSLKNRMKGA